MKVSSRRDHLIDTALKLFCRDGYRATGIDTLLAEAGVAKMTLYNNFGSKEALILAALRRRDEQFRLWFVKRVEAATDDPRERLLAVFDVLDEWLRSDTFRGCAFINAAVEYPELRDPIHTLAAEHKRLVALFFERLAAVAGAREPAELAAELSLLKEGAIVTAQVSGRLEAARDARRAAARLLASALAGAGREGEELTDPPAT